MTLYREQLDTKACDSPGCDHSSHGGPMAVTCACHPLADKSRVGYQRGRLTITCAVCGGTVCQVAVASERRPEPSVN